MATVYRIQYVSTADQTQMIHADNWLKIYKWNIYFQTDLRAPHGFCCLAASKERLS